MNSVEVIYDGQAFVPTTTVDLPKGTRCVIVLETIPAIIRSSMTAEEADRVLSGSGEPLPWTTVDEALGHPRYQA